MADACRGPVSCSHSINRARPPVSGQSLDSAHQKPLVQHTAALQQQGYQDERISTTSRRLHSTTNIQIRAKATGSRLCGDAQLSETQSTTTPMCANIQQCSTARSACPKRLVPGVRSPISTLVLRRTKYWTRTVGPSVIFPESAPSPPYTQ